MKLLHNNRGETLVEVLASILIATLSVALLFSCVMASSEIEKRVKVVDAAHYDALSKAEEQTSSTSTNTVEIERVTLPATATIQPRPSSSGCMAVHSAVC